MKKKTVGWLMAVVMLLGTALAWIPAPAEATSIKDKIQSAQGSGGLSQLEQNVDKSTSSFVSSVRKIFVTLTILFGVWLAAIYLRAGFSPDALRETKGRIASFFIFLILSFWTEQILGFLFRLLGIDLSNL